MNFLQLCNRSKAECGISGSPIVNVTQTTGELARVVDWVRDAYLTLQNERRWNWLWRRYVANLAPGTLSINPAIDWSVYALEWDRESFVLHNTALGLIDRSRLTLEKPVHPEIGAVQPGRPQRILLLPDRTLQFPAPLDAAYTLQADYYSTAEALINNADVPGLPEQYHMAIVWRSVMHYAQHEEAVQLLQLAGASYQQLLSQMLASELRDDFSTGTLA